MVTTAICLRRMHATHRSVFVIAVWVEGTVASRLETVEVSTKTSDSLAGKNSENIALVFSKLWWRVSAKGLEIVTEEGLHPRQTQMCKFLAVIKKNHDTLNCQI